MSEIAIIIPSRLSAKRLPGKPLKLINGKEMILHVYESAKKAKTNNVFVATPDQKILNLIEYFGGKAFLTKEKHKTGTDRVFEVYKKKLKKKPKIIVNLQGDMPNIKPNVIIKLIQHMKKSKCDIGTLASDLNFKKEFFDKNVVKVITNKKIGKKNFETALDFSRKINSKPKNIYHHIGIYAFTKKALIKFVNLKRSKLEKKRNLEQLRALENHMKIDVGYVKYSPLSVDTKKDLVEVNRLMKK